MQKMPYLGAVGSLMYLAICTCPDIAYAVSLLVRFSANPGQAHWRAVKHLFRCFKGSLDLQLTYRPTAAKELFVTFSEFGNDPSKLPSMLYMDKNSAIAVVKMQSFLDD